MNYPWYKQINSPNAELLQGDLIPNCPIIIPPRSLPDDGIYDFDIVEYDVVIVSQSCDLENGKVENVLVCPYTTFQQFQINSLKPDEKLSKNKIRRDFDDFRKGNQPNYHLLEKDPNVGINDYLVVDFRNVFAVHIDFLKTHVEFISNRARLLPPYREHLSQAFARFFMRVGLPQNISTIDPDNYIPSLPLTS